MDTLFAAADESRKHVLPWMAWLHTGYNRHDAELWAAHSIAAWNEGSGYEFVIYDRDNGRVAGACGLNEFKKKDMVCNLGYWVAASKLRLGAATQAVALLTEFALGPLGFNRVEIVVAEGNKASRAVAEKSGAIYEGLQRCRVQVGGKIYDAHMYAHVRALRT